MRKTSEKKLRKALLASAKKDLETTNVHDALHHHLNDIRQRVKTGRIDQTRMGTLSCAIVCAAFSAVMYWIGSSKAAIRYHNYSGGWFPEFLPKLGGAITNFEFNTVSFLTIMAAAFNSKQPHSALAAKRWIKSVWLFAIITGFFTDLPVWYVGEDGQTINDLPNTISAIFNLVIYTDGAKTLLDWIHHLQLYSKLSLYCNGSKEDRELLKQRDQLVANINARRIYFEKQNHATQQQLIKTIVASLEAHIMANKPFTALALTTIAPHQTAKISTSRNITNVMLFSVLCVTGSWMNYGFTVLAYLACLKLLKSHAWWAQAIGMFGALGNAVTSLGFLVKGLVFLWNTINILHDYQPSIERTLYPKAFMTLTTLTLFFAAFSGFTCDQGSFDGINLTVTNATSTQLISSGVAANIGGAGAFNLPQSALLITTLLRFYASRNVDKPVRQQIAYRDGLQSLANTIQAMPLAIFKTAKSDRDFSESTDTLIGKQLSYSTSTV